MDNCAQCGSTEFFALEDGRSYCAVCQTRNEVVEECDDLIGLGHKVRFAKSQKSQERAKNWTSYEAYNILLAKQCDIVADLCNLGNDFKKLVLSLWAVYLDKNEVAFNEDVQFNTLPKLQHLMLKRDYNFIVKGEKEMKNVKKIKKISKESDDNSELDLDDSELDDQIELSSGNLKRKCQSSDVDLDLDEEATFLKDLIDKYSMKKYNKINSKDKIEIFMKIYTKREFDETDDDEKRHLEQIIINEQVKLNLLNEDDQDERKMLNDKILMLKERLHFSTYAKILIKNGLFKTLKKTDKKISIRDVNYMTSTKLICFIYIAIRLLNLDIYLYDLIRWIEFAQIPYFNLNSLLPNDWQFMCDDLLLFNRSKTPQLFAVNSNITALVNYLEIPMFPQPNMNRLIIRIANDLNLPDSLAKFICNTFDQQIKSNPKARLYLNKTQKHNWFNVPEYEVVAFGLILLNLKHLFCLNDYHEILLSKKLNSSTVQKNAFIWSEWERHIKFKLECFKTYIFPNKSPAKDLDIKNYAMLIDYYAKELNKPKQDIFERKLSISMRMANSISNDVPKLFEKHIEPESEIEPEIEIEPTFYPFISFKAYINRNFKTRNDDELNKDFKDKSIAYLFKNGCQNICTENSIIRAVCKRRNQLNEQNNEKIKFLISLASNYLNCYDADFATEIVSIEDHFFSDYYETVKFVKDVKKQQALGLKNATLFIDQFATNEAVMAVEKADIRSKKLRILKI